ncbi:hypothetical protein 2 [Beihai sobemo-like virus 18]|uniref:hypothetical protein 2 n=1 Tax=Beihai sobemo-like virus 18 TaxID=1922689 RepID=UPI0009094C8A|nr:hypothetical protein 2 [Beihai sobemo-like virus 18]APG75715.1 hypothetical protein 2 [Beihai sobemo-like virus 18]
MLKISGEAADQDIEVFDASPVMSRMTPAQRRDKYKMMADCEDVVVPMLQNVCSEDVPPDYLSFVAPNKPLVDEIRSQLGIEFPLLTSDESFGTLISTKTSSGHVLNPDSSSGHYWAKYGANNGEVFGWSPEKARYTGENRLSDANMIALFREKVVSRMVELYFMPVSDVIKVFIKHEPHKPEKVKQGKWRLIMGVCPTDQICAHLLFDTVLAIFESIPLLSGTAIGWSPMMEGGVSLYRAYVGDYNMVTADRSSWDWTVQFWLALTFISLMLYLCNTRSLLRQRIITNHILSMFGSRKFNVGASTFYMHILGVLLSGWKLTAFCNSLMQIICHHLACLAVGFQLPPPICMGDDTLQNDPITYMRLFSNVLDDVDPVAVDREYWKFLSSTGAILKMVDRFEDYSEFCGFRFIPGECYPVYDVKHAVALHNVPSEFLHSTLRSYLWLYCYDKEKYEALERWLRQTGGSTSFTRLKILSQINGVAPPCIRPLTWA